MKLRLLRLSFLVCSCRLRPRASARHGFPIRSAGQGVLPDQLRSEGAAGVRARRGHAAFLLVFGRGAGLPRRAQGRSAMRDRHVGNRVDPHVESAGRAGRIAQGRRAGAGGDRRGTPHRRQDRARARLHRSRRRLLQGLRDAPREGTPGLARQGLRGAGPDAIRPTTRRRSSTRSTSPGRRRRPTRPTRRISRRPPSSRTNSRSIPTIPASRTT